MVYFCDITFTPLCKDPLRASTRGPATSGSWTQRPDRQPFFRSPSGQTASTKFDAEGNLIIAEGNDFGGRRISKIDMKTGKKYSLTGLYNGRPYNGPNDLTIDEKGRIYFTDPRYFGYEAVEQPILGVYRIDPDGKVTHPALCRRGQAERDPCVPDQKTLYVIANDNLARLTSTGWRKAEKPRRGLFCVACRLRARAKRHGQQSPCAGRWFPNDAQPAARGRSMLTPNLYVAVHEPDPALFVYSPEGKVLATIPTGKGAFVERACTPGRPTPRIRLRRRWWKSAALSHRGRFVTTHPDGEAGLPSEA